MMKVGIVGWRGMVGSVLMDRMRACGDFEGIEPFFFSTSNPGGRGPDIGRDTPPLLDAHDLASLKPLDVIITCQGSGYTTRVYEPLRRDGWKGYWIDAASGLRMASDACIVLDPVNDDVIKRDIAKGILTYCGGNCTVSLMLMATAGLFREGLVEWVSSMTYQSASGAGARAMRELVAQMAAVGDAAKPVLLDPASSALLLDQTVSAALFDPTFPHTEFGAPLGASLIPWIDRLVEGGQTREEWKGYVETNKILQATPPIPIDGQCVRVGAMRCHSQALTIKLTRAAPLDEIESILAESHEWASVVENEKAQTLARLTPAAVTGTLGTPIGRLRKMRMGDDYLTGFTVGDQLLWGAAEPLRRMLRILRG